MKKQSEGIKFEKERTKSMKETYKILKPRMNYSKDYDILYIGWGNKDYDSTIEVTPGFRIDITKKGVIIGIEIEDFSKHQKENKL